MNSNPTHIALNSLDHHPPPVYANFVLYLRLKPDASPKKVFSVLQGGLKRVFTQLPWLGGKVHSSSSTSHGGLEIRYDTDGDIHQLSQFKFKELDSDLTYDDLKETAFHPSTVEDQTLTWAPFFADIDHDPEVFVAQANFIPGVCILTAAILHVVSDGTALNNVFKIWAENCYDLQLGNMPRKYPQEISDHNLVELIWSKEIIKNRAQQVPTETWRLLGLDAPPNHNPQRTTEEHRDTQLASAPGPISSMGEMKACIFYLPPKNIKDLQDECAEEPGTADVSLNDVICALIWRCLLRARKRGTEVALDAQVRLDLPFDARPYFPELMPSNYLGNFTMINQALTPLSSLVGSTSIGSIARVLREVAGEATPSRIMDAYTMIKTLVKDSHKLENLKVDGNGLMITSFIAFDIADVNFGEEVFGNGGRPETVRPLMGPITQSFRYCAILPRKQHGGVEFLANLFDDELDSLLGDEEFIKFAMFVA
ncbi:hypothetical protein GL218_07136 [Daldinia childiae]|uniref:uncharacterized protein n=1 Tax=Daldinia childiae TaxID=326645 RepID=UPI001444BD79|nr:uncharacterized protein GL218_07136 [Daldinia childiae]KAF3055681.1 hypothetical protein GL218_07136 [Daldinia childiae]